MTPEELKADVLRRAELRLDYLRSKSAVDPPGDVQLAFVQGYQIGFLDGFGFGLGLPNDD